LQIKKKQIGLLKIVDTITAVPLLLVVLSGKLQVMANAELLGQEGPKGSSTSFFTYRPLETRVGYFSGHQ
jgi:hypothetical protein